ncbi:hypothetical protein TRICI_004954 [Trichomonascus ciferrii]|uniref:Ribosomal RNA-processing protein 8 n=1 Tax=Trichomonascus ciferrii TaxID=44093 RepID=A0A642UXJ3_9ASCO|nr:hypothetical protein TRICI_004954 [Trichomonascus ciferrii]
MSLFQVEGWNLPTQIAKEDPEQAKKKKQKQKKKQQKGKNVDPEKLQDMYKQAVDAVKPKGEKEKDKKKKRKRNEGNDDKNKEKKSKTNEGGQPEKESKKVSAAETSKKVDSSKLTPLQRKMQEKLAGSRFRWINEQLYTSTSSDALKLIEENPDMFDEYHNGFRNQVKSWPQNPVDAFLDQVKERLNKPIAAPGGLPGDKDGTVVIADMGCGEAQFAKDLQHVKGHGKSKKAKFKVHSFDLKAANEFITVADIKNVPLPDESAHVVVFCLALMGTNFLDFIKEGLRILKPRGEIWIAEIKSRFGENDTKTFVNVLKDFGLMHKTTDDSNKMFVRFEFFKPPKEILEDQRKKKQKQEKPKFIENDEHEGEPEGKWLLKPCIYKRR